MERLTINNIPEIIQWYNMQMYLDDKTLLHYIELQGWDEDEEGNIIPLDFEISYTFYDKHYFAKIYWKNICEDDPNIYQDGSSILFSSAEDNIIGNHWNLICRLLKKYTKERSINEE